MQNLFAVKSVYAGSPTAAPTGTKNIYVTPPSFLTNLTGENGLSNLLGWGIKMVFVLAAIIVFYQLIMGAFEWVQSSGEKEKVEKARKQITSSLIGLIILFGVFALVVVVEQIFGIGLGFTAPIVLQRIGTV